jgi:predicted transposase/invertase (TIGR01784 family)
MINENSEHEELVTNQEAAKKEVFLNPFTDFGFKKIFGQESSKLCLLDFLNSFLPQKHQIASFVYSKNELLANNPSERKAVIDIYCTAKNGEHIIIELQKSKQTHFVDRALYYSSFLLNEQGRKGDWNYELKPVYTVCILEFEPNFCKKNKTRVVYTSKLKDDDNEEISDKLMFIYIALPKFRKKLEEIESNQDKWLYLFKNLADLKDMPKIYEANQAFNQAFDTAKIAQYSDEEMRIYRDDLKTHWDLHSVLDTAKEEGKIEGLKEGMEKGMEKGMEQKAIETARGMKADKLPLEVIAKYTGLSIEQIKSIK